MACGSPVIGSAIGGILKIIGDSRYGFLVKHADPESIVKKMRTILDMDDESREMMIESAQKRVRDQFGGNAWIEKIIDGYDQAMSIRKKRV